MIQSVCTEHTHTLSQLQVPVAMWRTAVWERSCDKRSDREAVQVAGTNEVTSPSFILSTLSHLLKLLWAHFLSSVVFIARSVCKCKPCRAMPIFLKPGSIFTCFAVLIIYTHQKLWNRSNRSAQRLHCDPASVFLSEVFILIFFPPVCCSLINAPVFLSALPPFNYSFIHPLSLFCPPALRRCSLGEFSWWWCCCGWPDLQVSCRAGLLSSLSESLPTLTRRFRTFLWLMSCTGCNRTLSCQ